MLSSEISAAIINKFPDALEGPVSGSIVISKESLLDVAQYLKSGKLAFDNLHCITAIDTKEKIELNYTLYSIREHHAISLKIYLTYDDLHVGSLTGIWKSANWLEREVYDLFGVNFLNHPDLRRILNPYDWKEYPLRKNYSNPEFIAKPRL
ncbi:MAG: NADH-quinone oxidoreductase subunit C [Candidatus Omnitrophota bacterium]|nr:NADH-quinone oxidoreductase subunit C [Candidatus Omnitrophota bacterium]